MEEGFESCLSTKISGSTVCLNGNVLVVVRHLSISLELQLGSMEVDR